MLFQPVYLVLVPAAFCCSLHVKCYCFLSAAFVRGEEASIEDDADWLLKFYDTFRENTESCGSLTEAALSSLAQLKGSFGEHKFTQSNNMMGCLL